MKRQTGKNKTRESGEFWLSEMISVCGADRRVDGHFREEVCVGWRVLERPLLTQTYSPHRQEWYVCSRYVHYIATHCQSNLMMESEGLDPSAFPHQSRPHSLCQPESLATTSDPASSCTTRRANGSNLALQIQRSDKTFPHEAAVWDLLYPQLDMTE